MDNEEDLIFKKNSIKNRLQRYFLGMTLSVIAMMSLFSIVYFYFTMRKDAASVLKNKLEITQIFLENEKNDVKDFAENLANNHALQLGLQLNSPSRIDDYLKSSYSNKNKYSISVYNEKGDSLVDSERLTPGEQFLLSNALSGSTSVSTELSYYKQKESPALVCAAPVFYNKNVIGVILVRFIFKENLDFFINLSKNMGCDLMIYLNAEPIVATSSRLIDMVLYSRVAFSEIPYEKISFSSSGLNEYIGIISENGTSCGVLHLYVSSIPYVRTFATALLIYIACAIIITILVVLLTLKISSGIIGPINELLNGVNIIRGGNLKYEIELGIRDEIGRLGIAFNDMRSQLDDKMTTITDMNASLENKVTERTEKLNKLNESMKHYLSPQLYESIVGGKRDSSISRHYRKKLTIFFSDVKNFTSTTDSLEPEDLSNILNSYLDNMARIAEKYKGTIDKYVGDAVMVFFGDPEFTSDRDHALRAVKMAMEMQEFLIGFRREWLSKGVPNPFHVRMGINTGYCTIGNFGSEMKMDYTIIGNNVNLAARFEAACEPDSILISPDTYVLVKDEIKCKEAGTYELKGIPEPIKGYTPLGIKVEKKPVFAEIDDRHLIFPEAPIDISKMDKTEKRKLLIAIKDVFDTIKLGG